MKEQLRLSLPRVELPPAREPLDPGAYLPGMSLPALEPPRARNSDPGTSQRAAIDALRVQVSHSNRIVAALAALPDGGTYHEIARAARLNGAQVWRRLPELERANRIRLALDPAGAAIERRGEGGSMCRVWLAIIR